MKNPIYVIGHKNPDTDSIVSAIAYAQYLKHKKINAVASRIGSTNSETEFLLERFGFDEPKKLYTARSLLKEIEMDKPTLITKDITMKEALDIVLKRKNRSAIVIDKDKKIEGVISLSDLTYMWTKTDEELEKIVKEIEIDNIVKTLQGKTVVKGQHKLSGKLHIFPSLKSRVEKDSIVLLRNEDDKIEYCLNHGAVLLVVVTSSPISKNVIKMTKEKNAIIITTTLSPLSVTRLIYQTPTIEHVMQKKEKLVCFDDDETVQDVSKKIIKSRHRSYPVINDEGRVVGAISRYHLFNYQKKRFILVDHNEYKQTINDIEDGEIVEIVDHHRFGGFETENPINVITKPVGSTSSIIAKMYIDNKIPLSKEMAGLLLGGIISDTINLNSPTTTKEDIEIVKILEKKSGVKANLLSKQMVEHSESILSKRNIEIVYDDFKEFNIDGVKVGLSQTSCKSKEEYDAIKNDLQLYLDDACKSGMYELMAIMLTNPNGSGSYVMYAGNKKYLLDNIFVSKTNDNYVKGLVSRKKQLLPQVIKAIGEQ